MDIDLLSNIFYAMVRCGTPLLLVALGELICEKSGVLNLGQEGMMLFGAVIGFIVALNSGNLWLGVLLAMPFWLFESVGALLDNQRGALAGGQLNPSLGPNATPIGHMFKQLAIFLLMATLGLGALTQVIWDSYLIWPPTVWFPLPAPNGMSVFLGLLGDTFTHMMLYAAPFIAVLLLLEFGIALLGVYSQQLQVSTLAPPVKCLAGIGILLLYFALLQDLIVGRMGQLSDLKHSLGLLFKAPMP